MADFAFFEDFDGNPVLFSDDQIDAVAFAGGNFEVDAGTTYVAVAEGNLRVNNYWVGPGMYACAPAPAMFYAHRCRAVLVTVKRYKGMFALGGPIEAEGRLRYISGCTDTGLIQPLRLGDPCLNYLHFPARTVQAEHFHPSHRIGLVCGGEGLCFSWSNALRKSTSTVMRAGGVFVLPVGTRHWFETTDQALEIIAFHPDSEFGPTDESHQMLNATKSGEPAVHW